MGVEMDADSGITSSINQESTDTSILIGRELANPPPGEEVCITGISGVFPNSKDVYHFRDNLMDKTDMVDGDYRRWNPIHPEIPQRTGKIYDIEKFDPGFFGVHHRQTKTMDPMTRIFMEKTIEAILDAGLHPSELEGTKTGVFAGVCFAESEREIFFEFLEPQQFGITGCMRSMITNRVSYFLKLKGPSFVADTACSSSLYALENAYTAIRLGLCDMAIVGGANLCLHPFVSLQFARLGVLSTDGCCKSFDATGNGYCRSEAINCIFLQKAKDAKRIYSTVVHAKTNCDGYKEQGITYPSGEMQKRLLQEFYEECGIAPSSLSFLEAHGTGTTVGDPEEVSAIDEVFCPGRERPLLIGSVKSNIGHSEPASGLCSIAKVVIGMEENMIPPNIHYSKPREGVKALEEQRIQVVAEKMPFQDDRGLIGINSFGFGGGNCHILLKWNEKIKKNKGLPEDNIPRLLCLSGRTKEAITELIDDVNKRKLDVEYVHLLHEIFKKDIEGHIYRGYTVLSKHKKFEHSLKQYLGERKPLLLAFTQFGDDWKSFAKHLCEIPIFKETMRRIHAVLLKKSVNLTDIIKTSKSTTPVLENILGSLAVQIGVINILQFLEVEVTSVIGHMTGELACSYFDCTSTLEEVFLIAYEIGIHLEDFYEESAFVLIRGELNELKNAVTSHNNVIWKKSNANVLICGEPNSINSIVNVLKNRGADILFEFRHTGMPFTNKHSSKIGLCLLPKLRNLISQPKHKTRRWLASSTNQVITAEYIVEGLHPLANIENLHVDREHILLEIGNGFYPDLLKLVIRKKLELLKFPKLVSEKEEDCLVAMFTLLGRLYEYGFNPQIQNLYPKVEYPVSRGTPMIAPKIKWEHSKDWHVLKYQETQALKNGERFCTISLREEDWQFASGHVVDGRNLFPATGYLRIVWDTLALIKNMNHLDVAVVFEDCKFKRATTLGNSLIEFNITIQRKTGRFEVTEGGMDIVTGKIQHIVNGGENMFTNLDTSLSSFQDDEVSLESKDIYKELRLRGYNYRGVFRGMEKYNHKTSVAYIKWDGNWIAFMDNMLQVQILHIDTRLLYVPTGIKKMIINPLYHMKYVESFGEDPVLPVYVVPKAGIIRCGGIEIRGLLASSIPRRKQRSEPVLEKYVFVPNEATMTLLDSLRVNIHIGLENILGIKMKLIEVLDNETMEGSEPLSPMIFDVFADLPLMQANITILTKEKLELPNVTVEAKELRTEDDCHFVIGSKILERAMMMQQAFSALKEHGFILSREEPTFDPDAMAKEDLDGIDILTIHDIGSEKLVLFRKAEKPREYTVIKVSERDNDFEWLPSLQTALKNEKHIILFAQNEPLNGLLGLYNCIRREPGGMKVICVLVMDNNVPEFDLCHPFYENQIKRNMAVNIYKDGIWGTYRHLVMTQIEEVTSEHCFANTRSRGDLSSLRWVEGQLNSKSILQQEKELVQIYYASLNFRDVMTASGRINADVITSDRTQQECVEGFEFAGRLACGRRVMGMVVHGALSTLLAADSYLLLDIPECWTMEQAASVPVVYGTVLYALMRIGKMKRGDSVLIHSGTGGVGQAAINVAISQGCTIFTTVGTPEKREFLKQIFPELKDEYIGNSRDTSFERMIKKQTNGEGVDLVLNSLSEEKLLASIRCLKRYGRFLEIGKFDLASNNSLHMMLLEKGCSFHGIMLDQLFHSHPILKRHLSEILQKGIAEGFIKPLNTIVFKMNELEQAFRHMATGKHTGKILIKIREEEQEMNAKPPVVINSCIPRFACHPEKSYIIVGGLGGFGLELCDWLILRGARRIILTSRTGVKTGYQSYRLSIWKSYGTCCKVSTADVTTKEGCEELISQAESLGPVESVFNLAVVLRDNLLETQTPESFRISLAPKAIATKNLDEITRRRCPNLRDFVVFSSVSCGRGNASQTNYGMANSVMERICEQRKIAGFPALAIEWGAIGDVGLVADMMEEHTQMEIGGTLQQSIFNCLQVMDTFLRQKESTIVSSMLVAEKRSGIGGANNIVDAVANILGIKKQSVSPHTTLSELGMDSMTAVEIKQVLEREYEVFLTAQDIRSMTFARLQEIQDTKEKDKEAGITTQRLPRGFELILRYLGDEATSTIPVLRLPSLVNDDPPEVPYVFCFPGIEGFATSLKPLVANIRAKIIGIQFCYKNPTNSYKDLAIESEQQILNYVTPEQEVHMITYSWGTIIGLETMALLESKGYKGTITCIDGAPDMLAEMWEREMKTGSEAEFETIIICHLMAFYLPYDIILKNREKIYKCATFEERMLIAHKVSAHDATHSPQYQKKVAVGFHTRLKELRTYEPNYLKIQSVVRLFKPSTLSVQNLPDDYKLSRLCSNPVEVKLFEGNHITILENPLVADAINEMLGLAPINQEDDEQNNTE